ncbi:MAG TPA: hypothetical protein VGP47_05665, partial [Parachlamydiaceae bacterium]|nr:hypothetical protein [Parachlamydiaceae bacterium]
MVSIKKALACCKERFRGKINFMTENKQKLSMKNNKIQALEALLNDFKVAPSDSEKLAILDGMPDVINFLKSSPLLEQLIEKLDTQGKFVVKLLLAIGQG